MTACRLRGEIVKSYRILPAPVYGLGAYGIAALRFEDMPSIRVWRNEQMDVLRQSKVLTEEDQTRYYENVIRPGMDMERPPMILFSYDRKGICIGYGGLTNLDWDSLRAEVSFLVATERTRDDRVYEEDFSHFLRLLQRVAFDELGLNRLFTETYDIRPGHVGILEAEGFRYEGAMKQHVRIDGRFVDSLLHGLLKEQYDAERKTNIR